VASKAVIPAKAGIQKGKKTGFRVEPGMTIKVKGLMKYYNSFPLFLEIEQLIE
jgi:hypothetical protein